MTDLRANADGTVLVSLIRSLVRHPRRLGVLYQGTARQRGLAPADPALRQRAAHCRNRKRPPQSASASDLKRNSGTYTQVCSPPPIAERFDAVVCGDTDNDSNALIEAMNGLLRQAKHAGCGFTPRPAASRSSTCACASSSTCLPIRRRSGRHILLLVLA